VVTADGTPRLVSTESLAEARNDAGTIGKAMADRVSLE